MIGPVLIALLACGGKQAPAPEPEAPEPVEAPAPAPAETPVPTEPSAPPTPESVVGSWKSAACGPREYERWLTLVDDGSWTAEDRVSPCPEGAACIWSGIVIAKGTWTATDGGATLVETGADNSAGEPRPTALEHTSMGLVGVEGDARCPYVPR